LDLKTSERRRRRRRRKKDKEEKMFVNLKNNIFPNISTKKSPELDKLLPCNNISKRAFFFFLTQGSRERSLVYPLVSTEYL
jgi:hypothetical protein